MSARTHGESHLARKAGPGMMWVVCWCGDREVPVAVEDVQRCLTESCGAMWCDRPADWQGWCP